MGQKQFIETKCFSRNEVFFRGVDSSELTLQKPGGSIKLLDPTPRGSGSVDCCRTN